MVVKYVLKERHCVTLYDGRWELIPLYNGIISKEKRGRERKKKSGGWGVLKAYICQHVDKLEENIGQWKEEKGKEETEAGWLSEKARWSEVTDGVCSFLLPRSVKAMSERQWKCEGAPLLNTDLEELQEPARARACVCVCVCVCVFG